MAKNFYEQCLETPNQLQDELEMSRLVAVDKDIPWVSTPHDAKVKLMVANHLGYATMGSNVLKSEIPVGWHTGKHRHGEESMHILEGEGFSIINGQRFNWHTSSTLQIPARSRSPSCTACVSISKPSLGLRASSRSRPAVPMIPR
jgi:quercetin dioxygenase-like cupin family protein